MSPPALRAPLAPMSPVMRLLTGIVLLVPPGLLVASFRGAPQPEHLRWMALAVVALYAWIWLRWRPSAFVLDERELRIEWPLKTRSIPRGELGPARWLDTPAFKQELGSALRVGAGGLWGVFGLLWTSRRGWVEVWSPREDAFLLVERRGGRPLLIGPEHPERFLAAFADESGPAPGSGAGR